MFLSLCNELGRSGWPGKNMYHHLMKAVNRTAFIIGDKRKFLISTYF